MEGGVLAGKKQKGGKIIDVEKVRIMRGLGHQSSIKSTVLKWNVEGLCALVKG